MALSIASLPQSIRREITASLSKKEQQTLPWNWKFWRRDEQTAPSGDWDIWCYLAGRGAGKGRAASEWLREKVESHERAGQQIRVHLVARTAADARDTLVEGPSGILSISPPWFKPVYEPSKRRLTWPNGSMGITFSAQEPDALRGPQAHFAILDEVASWSFAEETYSNLQFGLRLGERPQAVVTTTPRPTRLMREILADKRTVVTHGTTYDNAGNLAPSFLERMLAKFEGTTLGRQELLAEMLDEIVGALWVRGMFDDYRVAKAPEMTRVVVAIDPATTSKKSSADTGIIVAGLGEDGRGYVLDDLTCHVSPNEWATRAIEAYHHWKADRIIGEVNNGGDLVETVIRSIDPNVAFSSVHASRGKYARAEPVAALYEQGKIAHVGMFAELEDQCVTWTPTDAESPDRVDALVWSATALMLDGSESEIISPTTDGLEMGDRDLSGVDRS